MLRRLSTLSWQAVVVEGVTSLAASLVARAAAALEDLELEPGFLLLRGRNIPLPLEPVVVGERLPVKPVAMVLIPYSALSPLPVVAVVAAKKQQPGATAGLAEEPLRFPQLPVMEIHLQFPQAKEIMADLVREPRITMLGVVVEVPVLLVVIPH